MHIRPVVTLLLCLSFPAALSLCQERAVIQDVVFNKLRQLPNMGACTIPQDPDLLKALTNTVTQARVQVQTMSDNIARMKDAGLVSQEALKQLTDSANKLAQALANPDVCAAARAFAQLSPVTNASAAKDPVQSPATNVPADKGPVQGNFPAKGANAHAPADDPLPDDPPATTIAPDGKATPQKNNAAAPVENSAQADTNKPGDQCTDATTSKLKPETISISTDLLDFGHQSLQTASDAKPVTITNNSDANVSVQLLASTIVPRNFTVSGCQGELEKNKQCTFNVTFSPFQARPRETFLAIVSKDDSETFENLSCKVNRAQGSVDKAEKDWRHAKLCEDHRSGKAVDDRSCPLPPKTPKTDAEKTTADQEKQRLDERCNKEEPGKLDYDCPSGIAYAKYQEARDAVAKAELKLRAHSKSLS